MHEADQEHEDYPHTPGTLYDCRACEENCYCPDIRRSDDLPCLRCQLQYMCPHERPECSMEYLCVLCELD